MDSKRTIIKIVKGAVQAEEVVDTLTHPAHGGQACFFGAVRNLNHGRDVLAVSYECHTSLAMTVLEEIVNEARIKWGDELVAVVIHGTEKLNVGEISVGIGVSTPHRDEAFEACRYIIEQLKVRAPIWKQEHYIDGDSEWLKGHELCRHSKHTTEKAL